VDERERFDSAFPHDAWSSPPSPPWLARQQRARLETGGAWLLAISAHAVFVLTCMTIVYARSTCGGCCFGHWSQHGNIDIEFVEVDDCDGLDVVTSESRDAEITLTLRDAFDAEWTAPQSRPTDVDVERDGKGLSCDGRRGDKEQPR
jgi:hypothetical protein